MHRRQASVFLAIASMLALGIAMGAYAEEQEEPGFEGDEKLFYVIGRMLSQNIKEFRASEAEITAVQRGIHDGLMNANDDLDVATYQSRIQALERARGKLAAADEKKAAAAFLEAQAAETGARKMPSGLIITEIAAGTGPSPQGTDQVKVHYHGMLRSGEVFDSSVERGEPAVFPLNRVIPCWTEGVAMMKTGGKSRLVCPSEIAYGDRGTRGIPGGAALVFEVELIEILGRAGG